MSDKPSVYIETTIPSFLTSRPSTNLIVAAKQEITRQWWERRKAQYELFISQYVLDEVSAGDTDAAEKRLGAVKKIDILEVDDEVLRLSAEIMATGLIPAKANTDAAHIAISARHSVDFLMTWNCTHIANAEIMSRINFVISKAGYFLPIICTPDELFGGEDYER